MALSRSAIENRFVAGGLHVVVANMRGVVSAPAQLYRQNGR